MELCLLSLPFHLPRVIFAQFSRARVLTFLFFFFRPDKFKVTANKPVYERRAALAAKVPKFWFNALNNCTPISAFIVSRSLLAVSWGGIGFTDIWFCLSRTPSTMSVWDSLRMLLLSMTRRTREISR